MTSHDSAVSGNLVGWCWEQATRRTDLHAAPCSFGPGGCLLAPVLIKRMGTCVSAVDLQGWPDTIHCPYSQTMQHWYHTPVSIHLG